MPSTPKIKALLIDLNGTIHVGREATPGAARALDRLRAARIPFIFCSNSSKESDARLIDRVTPMGITMARHELMTSLGACRQLVEDRGFNPFLLLSPDAKDEFAHLPVRHGPVDAVVVGLHEPSLSYESLNIAFRILKGEPVAHHSSAGAAAPTPHLERQQPVLIAPHTSLFQQTGGDASLPPGLSLGVGTFIRALELASGVNAQVVGKPTRGFYESALVRLAQMHGAQRDTLDIGSVGVVGDDVVNDLGGGALDLGLKRILVRTGKYRPGVEQQHGPPPDSVYDTFADFVDDLLSEDR